MRIYAAKAWLLLTVPTLYPGLPFGIVLLIGLLHPLAATAFGAWGRIGFPQGFVIEGIALAFVRAFPRPGHAAALPSQIYALPANAFVLVLLGVIVESFVRGLLRIKAAS